ncbi:MAG: transaldolase family protein [Lentisphaeria bacterium]|nr:transaldolase family protein [Lentisphaeria bacterium]
MKHSGYFHRVLEQTQTQFWINSAILSDVETALAHGAVGVTTNPTHPPRAIKADHDIWAPVIQEILQHNPDLTDDEVADQVTQLMAVRSHKLIHQLYEQSKGEFGYVAIQGNPFINDDLPKIVAEATRYSELGENIAVKIQSTAVGAEAVEELTALGIHTICTNGFSVAQGIHMSEAYQRGLDRTDARPRCFVVNIAGVFDEYLGEDAAARGVTVSEECLQHAGVIMTRRLHHVMKARGYAAYLLAGGSRASHHFSELVGDDLAVTISLSHATPLVETDAPVESRIDAQPPPEIMKELEDNFPDFRRACDEDGLGPDAFAGFGPCVKFQNACEVGYRDTVEAIRAERTADSVHS